VAPFRDTRQVIVQLLSSMSDSKEIRTYLQRFSQVDRARFAVIKIGGAVLEERIEETAAALAFLHTVGLTPIVLHGGGPQLDRALAAGGLESERRDDLRVTSSEVLDVARQVFTSENIRLVEAVRAENVAAHGLITGAFEADFVDRERYGYVGRPTEVHLELLRSIVRSGAIPILTCLGTAPGGQLVNMNADSAIRQLVHAVQPLKIIFLTAAGGLRDQDGNIIDSLNLVSDYDRLMAGGWVHSGMRLKIAEIKRLLDDSPASTSVSITTPAGLARELFTHGGSGTLIRNGERIVKATDKEALDQWRVEKLVTDAFGRELDPSWWSSLELVGAYVSESYRAGAFLVQLDDFVYLDKFAIEEEARGEGLARTVWDYVAEEYPAFFWRSRSDNSFNSFYAQEADGSIKRGPWTVFWRGEHDLAHIGAAVDRIVARPEAFVAP
jgi:acetylglutamate kinase